MIDTVNSIKVLYKGCFLMILLLLFISGCSPKISKYLEANKYISNVNIHVINDSLQLYFKTPGDLEHIAERKDLKRALRKNHWKTPNEVLLYARTAYPPYEYLITLGEKSEYQRKGNVLLLDTVVNGITIRFIGRSSNEESAYSLSKDLSEMFHSLKVGKEYNQNWSSIYDMFGTFMRSNKFYNISEALESYPVYNKQEEWLKLQLELTVASYLRMNERYLELLNEYESRVETNDIIARDIHKNVVSDVLAINKIIDEADTHRVVMVNENHFYPNHRILITDLLPRLKEIGYSYLALETLAETQDSLLNLEGAYPALETGYYTREQNYGNLLRQAKKLGYRFVAYENTDKTKDREIGEAENLFNKTFAIDSNAKVLVVAGVDHILEETMLNDKKRMAAIFKEKYHIDPLTISQTHLNIYRKGLPGKYNLIEKSNFTGNQKLNAVDLYILNNIDNASRWNSSFKYRNKSARKVQVSLFYSSELKTKFDYQNKIPYFTALLEKGKTYHLPINGGDEIYVIAYDIDGKVVESRTQTGKFINNETKAPRPLFSDTKLRENIVQ